MKNLIIISIVSSVLASCGKGGGSPGGGQVVDTAYVPEQQYTPAPIVADNIAVPTSTPVVSTPVPAVPVAPVIQEDMYIIGGDSHAERFQYFLAGNISGSGAPTSDLPRGNTSRVVGFTKKNMPASYWDAPGMAAPILNLVSTYCPFKPYFVWYQGEGETGTSIPGNYPTYTVYETKIQSFFDKVREVCPQVKIVVIDMTTNANTLTYANQFLMVQKNLSGVNHLATNPSYNAYATVTMAPNSYLNTQGYLKLWNDLRTQYPLK